MSDVAERNTTAVTIFGTEYRISASADPEYIHEVAAYVDRTMRDLHERLKLPSSTRLAILAALHITDEMLRARVQTDDVLTRVSQKAEALRLAMEPPPADEDE